MRTLMTKATLGLALGAAALTTAAPAEAQRWNRYRHYDRTGPAIAAGIIGLGIGAAIASSNRDRYYDRGYYYDRPYFYDRGYYARDGWYDRPYRAYNRCVVRRVYDPYIGRRVRVRYC
jgi:hypothetical protein